MKDELLYEEELRAGWTSPVRSADSYEAPKKQPCRTAGLYDPTLIRLIGKEVEHLDNPEAALDALLYRFKITRL